MVVVFINLRLENTRQTWAKTDFSSSRLQFLKVGALTTLRPLCVLSNSRRVGRVRPSFDRYQPVSRLSRIEQRGCGSLTLFKISFSSAQYKLFLFLFTSAFPGEYFKREEIPQHQPFPAVCCCVFFKVDEALYRSAGVTKICHWRVLFSRFSCRRLVKSSTSLRFLFQWTFRISYDLFDFEVYNLC